MTMMVPEFIPLKKGLVYLTGILEIGFAIGLLLPAYAGITTWALITFLILMIPGNIKAAVDHVDYQKGTKNGPGPMYLWFRIPLQLFFIAWICFFGLGI